MTSEPGEYEALWRKALQASRSALDPRCNPPKHEAAASILRDHVEARDAKRDAAWREALEDQRRQWAAAIQDKLDAYEAKLAEVRADYMDARVVREGFAYRDKIIADQAAELERLRAFIANPPEHRYWGAGEPDCPREIKCANGELHTMRCKVCGQDSPRDQICQGGM